MSQKCISFSGPDFVFLSQARLKLLPHKTGELHVLGVVYNLGTGEEDTNAGEGI